MSNSLIPRDLPQRVRVLQFVWFALTTMSIAILVVFWYLHDVEKLVIPGQPELPLARILAGVSLLLVILSLVLPDHVAHQVHPGMRPSFDAYQVACLVRSALLEVAVLLQAAAYLLEGGWWSLVLGGALVLLLLGAMPTRDTATRWIHRQDHLR